MSGKFTPGPWTASEGDGTEWFVTAPDAEDPDNPWNIAVVVGACGYPSDPRTGSTEDNARLIASAPAMHAALEKAEAALRAVDTAPIEYADAVFWPQVSEARTAIEAALALSHPLEEKS